MHNRLPHPGFRMGFVLMLLAIGVQVAFGMTVAMIVGIVEQASGANLKGLLRDPLMMAATNIAAFAAAISLGLWLNRLPPARAFPFRRVSASQWIPLVLIILGGGILTSEAENVLRWFWPMPHWVSSLFEDVFGARDRMLSRIFLIVIVAPITEELLFRGIILRGLLGRHRPVVAVLLSALLFALIHMNPWQFATTLLLGIVFGWLYLRTGSVSICILAHALHNGLSMLLVSGAFDVPGLTGVPDPDVVEFQPWWLDLIGLILLSIGSWWLKKATTERNQPALQIPPAIGPVTDPASSPPPMPTHNSSSLS